ncbi:DUF6087 family protein [[Kitasatospora] papulosa]|uniref:DUF6087 family protein n=1 Tax=[Kitasatospora] papulosa TaxID=1464011 RepID=UPI003698EC9F
MSDESLEEWAARRARRRPTVGERRPAPLGEHEQGAHVAPGEARGVQEWDGHQWVPVGVAEDLGAAARETSAGASARAERVPLPAFGRLPAMPEPWRPTEVFRRP